MAGQRTRIRFGAVSAEVLLEKTSTKPRGAQHETRRVLVEPVPVPPGITAQHDATAEAVTDPFGDPVAVPTGEGLPPGLLGPMGDPSWPARDDLAEQAAEAERLASGGDDYAPEEDEGPTGDDDPQPEPDKLGGVPPSEPDDEPDGMAAARARLDDPSIEANRVLHPERFGSPAAEYVPPATRVEQGVHLETGEWVDLTDQLADVDRLTRVDGLEVVRTIPASSYASERVRDAHYIAGVDPDTYKTLALLWRGLRMEARAAEVRWTKRTAQACGIIVARGELPSAERPRPAVPAHLLLLELEWAANVKRVPPRVFGPVRAEVSVDEIVAAMDLVRSFAAPAPRVELRDERLAKRGELLDLARAGRLAEYVPPAEPMPEDVDAEAEDLATALALSAAWVREHAPA